MDGLGKMTIQETIEYGPLGDVIPIFEILPRHNCTITGRRVNCGFDEHDLKTLLIGFLGTPPFPPTLTYENLPPEMFMKITDFIKGMTYFEITGITATYVEEKIVQSKVCGFYCVPQSFKCDLEDPIVINLL